jgi:hypothetical protein
VVVLVNVVGVVAMQVVVVVVVTGRGDKYTIE